MWSRNHTNPRQAVSRGPARLFNSLERLWLARPRLPAAGAVIALLFGTAVAMTGCTVHGMEEQPKVLPLQYSDFFPDSRGARPIPEGTVARGHLRTDSWLYEGRVNGRYVDAFPFPITPAILARGHERYDIYCAVCHDRAGTGSGMIVRRGLSRPPSYHTDRLRKAPVGHFYDVISRGYGAMYSYNDRIPVPDRWAIVAYLRALQLSQHATTADVPADQKAALR